MGLAFDHRIMKAIQKVLNRIASPVILILMCFAFGATYIPTNESTSPFDEYVHIDYLSKISEQPFVKYGEKTSELARNEISCRSVWPGEFTWGESCDSGTHSSDSKYPWSGYSTGSGYMPVYYVLTRVIAEPLANLNLSLVEAGRWVSVFWFTLGILLLYSVMRRLGIQKNLALGLLFIAIASPASYWTSTYITPDSMAWFVGGLASWIAFKIYHQELHPFLLVPFALFASSLKVVFFIVLVFLFLFFTITYLKEKSNRKESRRTWMYSLYSLIGLLLGIVLQVVWAIFQKYNSVGVIPPMGDHQKFVLSNVALEVSKFIGRSGSYGFAQGKAFLLSGTIIDLVSLLIVVALLYTSYLGVSRRTFLESNLLVTLFAGPILVIGYFATSGFKGEVFTLGPRYGVVLIPIWMVSIAIATNHKPFSLFALPLGLVSLLMVLIYPPSQLKGDTSSILNFQSLFPLLTLVTFLYFFSDEDAGVTWVDR